MTKLRAACILLLASGLLSADTHRAAATSAATPRGSQPNSLATSGTSVADRDRFIQEGDHNMERGSV